MSNEAAIRKGKGIVANPDFIVTFTLGGLFIFAMGLTIWAAAWQWDGEGHFQGWWGIGLPIGVLGLALVAKLTGLGQRLFVGLLSVGALFAGVLSLAVVFLLWLAPEGGMQIVDAPLSLEMKNMHGYGSMLGALLMGVIIVGLAPAVIFGEKILPLFVGLLAGAWGILSIIIFVMVIFGLHD